MKLKCENKIIAHFLAVSALSIAFAPISALAADLTFNSDVTLTQTSGNLTLKSGSGATTLVINANTVSTTVPASTFFKATAGALPTTSGDGNINTDTCDSGSVASVSLPSTNGVAKTFTITPGTTGACSASQASGGGSGSNVSSYATGVSSVPTPTPATVTAPTPPTPVATTVPNIQKQLATLQGQLATLQKQGSTATVTAASFNLNLSAGSKNSDVTNLQNFLKAQSSDIYPEGITSGVFGPLTTKAVQRFQEKYGIATPGDTGYGRVGPMTRAKINSLLNTTTPTETPVVPTSVPTEPKTTPAATTKSETFDTDLTFGTENSDIERLQSFLVQQGSDVYPEGKVSGYFGSLTKKAVQRFQEKYGIATPGDTGYGRVGPMTRAKINSLQQ